mgnify:FL=1|jgi:hypothetical protein
MNNKNKLQALSVSIINGQTFWQSKVGSEIEVIKHAKRYLKRKADLIIYDISEENNCKFVRHISYADLLNIC